MTTPNERAAPGPLSDMLRRAYDQAGLTAYAVAQKSGVSEAVLSRWLSGKRGITLGTADRIAAALGVRIDTPGNS